MCDCCIPLQAQKKLLHQIQIAIISSTKHVKKHKFAFFVLTYEPV